jgi:Xaa-Pro aminopeptidase
MLGYGRTGKLSDRVPVTVEPGVYLPGLGGVRIEDVLVVTAGDRARALTSTTRELLVL